MGALGLRGSPMWLAAGWALHPVWDIALHYFGPGRAVAPETYAIACLSYDLLVAAYPSRRGDGGSGEHPEHPDRPAFRPALPRDGRRDGRRHG
jgi:hypothetical protein